MEWYLIVLIVVFAWAFLTVAIYALIEDGLKSFLKHFHYVLLLSIILAIFAVLIVPFSLALFLKVVTEGKSDNKVTITKFKIPEIDEEVAITLNQLGFSKGKWESYRINRIFTGFKKGSIEITMDGRGIAFGYLNEKEKAFIKVLENIYSRSNEINKINNTIKRREEEIRYNQKKIEELKNDIKKVK